MVVTNSIEQHLQMRSVCNGNDRGVCVFMCVYRCKSLVSFEDHHKYTLIKHIDMRWCVDSKRVTDGQRMTLLKNVSVDMRTVNYSIFMRS